MARRSLRVAELNSLTEDTVMEEAQATKSRRKRTRQALRDEANEMESGVNIAECSDVASESDGQPTTSTAASNDQPSTSAPQTNAEYCEEVVKLLSIDEDATGMTFFVQFADDRRAWLPADKIPSSLTTEFVVKKVLGAANVPFEDIKNRQWSDAVGTDAQAPRSFVVAAGKQSGIDAYNRMLRNCSSEGVRSPPVLMLDSVMNSLAESRNLCMEFEYIIKNETAGYTCAADLQAAKATQRSQSGRKLHASVMNDREGSLDCDKVHTEYTAYTRDKMEAGGCKCEVNCSLQSTPKNLCCDTALAYDYGSVKINVLDDWTQFNSPSANFRTIDYKFKKVKAKYLKVGGSVPNIKECDPVHCKCSIRECRNALVQHGRTVAVAIFRTGLDGTTNKRFGVQALHLIPRGAYVMEYIGELISHREATHRTENGSQGYYLMELPEPPDDETKDEKRLFYIDAERKGSASRFINNSCDPNMGIVNVNYGTYSGRLPHAAFFALRDIKAGEELTYKYGKSRGKAGKQQCHCGAATCKTAF